MNGYPPSPWREHALDGKKYYYNTVTQVTTWTKPDELKDEVEVRGPLTCACN